MKKSLRAQIIKWYKAGLTVNEFAPLIPQYCRQEIEAVIRAYEKEEAWSRLMHG
nr:MAG: hypothetical protein [Bacteriophage sp.]